MAIYLLTNSVTYARAVVVAPSKEIAVTLHPTCDMAIRGTSGWYRWRGGHFGTREYVPPPEGWPEDLSLICADELAERESRNWVGIRSVMAYESSIELREKEEG